MGYNQYMSGEQLSFEFFTDYAVDATPGREREAPFPVEAADELATRESFNKHLYRPNTYLHKWWARRCGTTFRFILKQFAADLGRRDFYSPGGLEGLIVLDPMMGGGTTVHEAIRLGANVIGADIDPIPILQARATLTHVSLTSIRSTFRQFFAALRGQLASYYATNCPICGRSDGEIKFTLYALRKECECGEVLLVDSYVIRRETDRTIELCPNCHTVFSGEHTCFESSSDLRPLYEKARTCHVCGRDYRDLVEIPFRQRYVPIAIVGECPRHGQFFKASDQNDLGRLASAEKEFGALDFGQRESFAIVPGPKSRDLVRRGISHYLDLFSARQLAYIDAACRQLKGVNEPQERLVLSLLVSTSLEFNSMLCGYKGGDRRRPGAIRHTFSHHAYSFPYTAAENNPLFPGKGSGTLVRLFDRRVVRARKWAERPVERRIQDGRVAKITINGERDWGQEVATFVELRSGSHKFLLQQGDSRRLPLPDHCVDYIVTDPPYYDSVQYSDLAAFFRVWLRLLVPHGAEWDYQIEQSAVAEAAQSSLTKYYEILRGIFRECWRVLEPSRGRLVFTFHHWDPQAWAELTLALRYAGFHLAEKWVVHSENPVSVHIRSLRALKHDAVLMFAESSVSSWQKLEKVEHSDSYAFCEDCAAVLGWLLDSNYSDDEILTHWATLLEGR
jgi:putative DNA methylase